MSVVRRWAEFRDVVLEGVELGTQEPCLRLISGRAAGARAHRDQVLAGDAQEAAVFDDGGCALVAERI